MPLDPEVAALLEWQKGEPPRSSLSVAETRERMRRGAALAGTPPELPLVEDVELPGALRVRLYGPTTAGTQPIVLYLHGGRFFSGDLESHDTVCRRLALAVGCRVAAVDYRLAPEHPFPAAVEDAGQAYAWACAQGVGVAVVADSAGANLAATVALTHLDPAPRCLVLIYPMIDAVCASPSYAEYAEGYGPGAADMRCGWAHYLPAGADPRDPRVSPLYAPDLAGQPPALVVTAEYDTLRDEGETYARRLAEAGNLIQVRRYPGTIHGFFAMPGVLGVARQAMEEVAAFLRMHFGLAR